MREVEASSVLSASAYLANAMGTRGEEQRVRSRSKLTLLGAACCVFLAAGPAPLDFEASGFLRPVESAFCCVSYFLPCRIQEELQLPSPSHTPGESFRRLSSRRFRGLKQLGN